MTYAETENLMKVKESLSNCTCYLARAGYIKDFNFSNLLNNIQILKYCKDKISNNIFT